MYQVDIIDGNSYINYTDKSIDILFHPSIKESNYSQIKLVKIQCLEVLSDGVKGINLEIKEPDIKEKIKEAQKKYGNYILERVIYKDLKINNIWSEKLWEEKKVAKMEQVL